MCSVALLIMMYCSSLLSSTTTIMAIVQTVILVRVQSLLTYLIPTQLQNCTKMIVCQSEDFHISRCISLYHHPFLDHQCLCWLVNKRSFVVYICHYRDVFLIHFRHNHQPLVWSARAALFQMPWAMSLAGDYVFGWRLGHLWYIE